MQKKSPSAQSSFKKLDPATKQYISALKTENLKLQRQIAKLQVKDLSKDNRIKALEKEIKNNAPQVHINLQSFAETALKKIQEGKNIETKKPA